MKETLNYIGYGIVAVALVGAAIAMIRGYKETQRHIEEMNGLLNKEENGP